MRKFKTITPDHPISRIANEMSGFAEMLAATHRISRFDVCVALVNAAGQILADGARPSQGGKPLLREEAIKRMDDLRRVMEGAYDLRSVEGEA